MAKEKHDKKSQDQSNFLDFSKKPSLFHKDINIFQFRLILDSFFYNLLSSAPQVFNFFIQSGNIYRIDSHNLSLLFTHFENELLLK